MHKDLQIIDCQSYKIIVGNFWSELQRFLHQKNYSSLYILVDENSKKHCLPILQESLSALKYTLLEIKSGEELKSLDTCRFIWQEMINTNADRHSVLINLGGGVIGDMGGFCAATYMRGIEFIQIPTTLLAQVDASVGSKLGIDFNGYKNLIGCFNDPQLVCINTAFLNTLSSRQLKSGFAEVIKHALIRDKKMWSEIKSVKLEKLDWNAVVFNNIMIKKAVVEADPYENGLRKILNFGHTIGHAIETHFLHTSQKLLHGESIAIGMICESHLSFLKGYISKVILDDITSFIFSQYKLPIEICKHVESIIENLEKDKKNISGEKQFSLIDHLGSCLFNITIEDNEIRRSFKYYDECRNN